MIVIMLQVIKYINIFVDINIKTHARQASAGIDAIRNYFAELLHPVDLPNIKSTQNQTQGTDLKEMKSIEHVIKYMQIFNTEKQSEFPLDIKHKNVGYITLLAALIQLTENLLRENSNVSYILNPKDGKTVIIFYSKNAEDPKKTTMVITQSNQTKAINLTLFCEQLGLYNTKTISTMMKSSKISTEKVKALGRDIVLIVDDPKNNPKEIQRLFNSAVHMIPIASSSQIKMNVLAFRKMNTYNEIGLLYQIMYVALETIVAKMEKYNMNMDISKLLSDLKTLKLQQVKRAQEKYKDLKNYRKYLNVTMLQCSQFLKEKVTPILTNMINKIEFNVDQYKKQANALFNELKQICSGFSSKMQDTYFNEFDKYSNKLSECKNKEQAEDIMNQIQQLVNKAKVDSIKLQQEALSKYLERISKLKKKIEDTTNELNKITEKNNEFGLKAAYEIAQKATDKASQTKSIDDLKKILQNVEDALSKANKTAESIAQKKLADQISALTKEIEMKIQELINKTPYLNRLNMIKAGSQAIDLLIQLKKDVIAAIAQEKADKKLADQIIILIKEIEIKINTLITKAPFLKRLEDIKNTIKDKPIDRLEQLKKDVIAAAARELEASSANFALEIKKLNADIIKNLKQLVQIGGKDAGFMSDWKKIGDTPNKDTVYKLTALNLAILKEIQNIENKGIVIDGQWTSSKNSIIKSSAYFNTPDIEIHIQDEYMIINNVHEKDTKNFDIIRLNLKVYFIQMPKTIKDSIDPKVLEKIMK